MRQDDLIYVAGHRGLLGSAILRQLESRGFSRIVTRSRVELDLTRQADVDAFFAETKPTYVFLAAGRAGGIVEHRDHPAEMIHENLQIQTNAIDAAYRYGTRKLLFVASSATYPNLAAQPIAEEALLGGPIEPTHIPYAIAKIAGIQMLAAYHRQYGFRGICALPTNLFGPNDNFDPKSSHVIPGLIRKLHDAKVAGAPSASLWGTGTPRREFLHADDCADACLHLMDRCEGGEIINVGTGEDMTILETARQVGKVVGFEGELLFDATKPDGTPRRRLDVSKLRNLSWFPKIDFAEGVRATYAWFLENEPKAGPVPRG